METGSRAKIYPPPYIYEPDKHNKKLVKDVIPSLKAGCSKISSACGIGILAYNYNMMEYLCNVDSYVARASLNNCPPYEAFWRETPDI